MIRLLPLFALCLGLALAGQRLVEGGRARDGEPRWWKGNTHTHTLWSDGDAAPEVAAAWYRDHGYDFLVLSDHNVLSEGERWFPVSEDRSRRLHPEHLDALRERFGTSWVELREDGGRREMRLRTLVELRERFESPGEFLFLQGEEVTSSFRQLEPVERSLPVHVNGLNLAEHVPPQGGASAREVMNANVDAILEQGARLGRPVLAHVNHPNFGWGLTWEDVAHVVNDRFFEVYNGHRRVFNEGDGEHASTELMWDRANALRLTELDLPLLFGVATDDTHEYWAPDRTSVPGRGWVMVRAEALEAGALVDAMRSGDFYASSGVELERVEFDGRRLSIEIAPDEGATYRTFFRGALRDEGGAMRVGETLAEVEGTRPSFELTGEELFVRALVVSSLAHPDPYAPGDPQMAWVQPVRANR